MLRNNVYIHLFIESTHYNFNLETFDKPLPSIVYIIIYDINHHYLQIWAILQLEYDCVTDLFSFPTHFSCSK